uniref:Golgi transport 1Bb n=1 Tax=Monopterus albus TaxID=43700 RepID=A0A3Q3QMZ4_MONAL
MDKYWDMDNKGHITVTHQKWLIINVAILFVSGLSFIIGLERTLRFFFQRHKVKATSFFLGGVFVVLIGWPIIGIILEIYGFFLLFRGFFPVAVGFIRRVPVLGSLLSLPWIRSDPSVEAAGMDSQFVSNQEAKAGRVQVGAATDDAVLGKATQFPGYISQHINCSREFKR